VGAEMKSTHREVGPLLARRIHPAGRRAEARFAPSKQIYFPEKYAF